MICNKCGKKLEKLSVMLPRIKDNILCIKCAKKEIIDEDDNFPEDWNWYDFEK
jgi:hypothetical protein